MHGIIFMDITDVVTAIKNECTNIGNIMAFGEDGAYTLMIHYRHEDDTFVEEDEDWDEVDLQRMNEYNYRHMFLYQIHLGSNVQEQVDILLEKCKRMTTQGKA